MNIAALTKADNVALDDMDVSDPKLCQDDTWYPYFARLPRAGSPQRRECC